MTFRDYSSFIGRQNFLGRRKELILCCCILLVGLSALWGCGKKSSGTLEEGLVLYRQNKLDQALPLFERAIQEDGKDPDAYAWLAETYRRLGRRDKSFEKAMKALELDPFHSFAHTVLADDCNPMYGGWERAHSDTTWTHLLKAVVCDSSDGNAWVSIWSESIRRGELQMMKRSLHSMVGSGFLTTAALSYARWMLRPLPDHAILVTNGDMDTYPAVALQEVEGFRSDVAVVNRSLLNTTWYARFVRDHYGVKLPVADSRLDSLAPVKDKEGNVVTVSDQILGGWLDQKTRGAFGNPIAMAVTVQGEFVSNMKDHLRMAGPFLLWVPKPSDAVPDTGLMRVGLAGINPDDFVASCVSAQDRSPVRRVFTDGIVRNITATALMLGEEQIKAGRHEAAQATLDWADMFDRKTVMGPAFGERIAALRKSVTVGQK